MPSFSNQGWSYQKRRDDSWRHPTELNAGIGERFGSDHGLTERPLRFYLNPGVIAKTALARRRDHALFDIEIGSPTRAVIPESRL